MMNVSELTIDELKKCIDKGEFEIYLQPQYSVRQNRIVGAEALVRWQHAGAFISPAEFIPILEECHLIHELDVYVWECAFRLQSEKKREGYDLIPFSINVSRRDINRIDICHILSEFVQKYQISAEYIHIEITESAFVEDTGALFEMIGELKRLGFKIMIDDFGSGYSALNILKDIDADAVKLDMKFFDFDVKNSARARNVIGAVIDMTSSLDIGVVAEGVENGEQLDILTGFGCDIIQGFFFYQPMSITEFDRLMHRLYDTMTRKELDAQSFGTECLEESKKLLEDGEYDKALNLANRALEQLDNVKDVRLYCDMLNVMGIIYGALGNELLAVEYYLEGLSLAKKNNDSYCSGKFYNNIGSEYQELNDHESAIKYFETALQELHEVDRAKEESYDYLAFTINMNLCMEYNNLAQYEKAETYLERARGFCDSLEDEDAQLGLLLEECRFLMQTGKESDVRKRLPKLMALAVNTKDQSNFWSNMETLCNLTLTLGELAEMKQIIDYMDRQLNLFSNDLTGLDIKVKVSALRLAYYKEIQDAEQLRLTELEYIDLCRLQHEEVKKARAQAIDYKIQLNMQYEENILFRKQIDIDPLTGVGNRYKLEKDYKMLKGLCGEKNCKVGVGIIDVDYFKMVNDTYGHLQGDCYLKTISTIIKQTILSTGDVYRYGGDEFVVLLIDVDSEAVESAAKKIELSIAEAGMQNQQSPRELLSVSQGYVILDSIKDGDIWQVLPYADQQLYLMKNNGKHGYRITQEA